MSILLPNKNQYSTQSVSQCLARGILPKYKLAVANPINLNKFHIRNDIGQLYLRE